MRSSARGPALALMLAAAAALPAAPAPAGGQQVAGDEVTLLEAAQRQEMAGDLVAAERSLRAVLEHRVTSVPALLSLQRVLAIQGRVGDLVPALERALAEDPGSVLIHELRVRTLASLGREEALQEAAEGWIAAMPRVEIPYREVAAVWRDGGDYQRALEVLERGRAALDRPDALALELGDLHLALGDHEGAAEEWTRAIDGQGRGLSQVRRRLRDLPDRGHSLIPGMVAALSAAPETERVEAALDLAVEAGLRDRVRQLADEVLPTLSTEARRSLMEEIGQRSEAANRPALAYWAYRQWLDLGDHAAGPPRADGAASSALAAEARLVAVRNRLAELALELGDTAAAAAQLERVGSAADPGTPAAERAAAARIELLVHRDPERAADELERLLRHEPPPSSADALGATVADALLRAGRGERAARVLGLVDGPLSSALRGRLALVGGDLDGARVAYMKAAAGFRGSQATEVLGLVTLLGRLGSDSGRVVGEAALLRSRGRAGEAVDRIRGSIGTLPTGERAPVLAFAAGLADEAGLRSDAREIRRSIAREHPRTPEAPAALLALARSLDAEADGRAEAREHLERLIIEYPRSALVPQARRELERIRQGDDT